ncbi:uncharacterized protein TNIN_280451 [Trichonephila inaurata madagascariensis]|uniref:IGFBP N-terminal domain-containing protein n=1 Tax=Trichonephila inaurata madagascariensis TaxID=2747483 RepID=A0A8X6X268_9ARAC|nr:uncharacterized protein TNIN_280451 [Trichonephila inaurata madagascariensis]
MVRRWSRQFSEGRRSVHDEERSGRPSLINHDLVEQRVMESQFPLDIHPYNKMLRIILLISVGIVAANAIACPHNYCDDVCCDDDVECSDDEILVEHGSFCGCCDVCRTIIREGQPCPPAFRGSPPTSQCEEGTTCKSTNQGRICGFSAIIRLYISVEVGEACPRRRFVGGPPPAWECEMGTTCMDTGDGSLRS